MFHIISCFSDLKQDGLNKDMSQQEVETEKFIKLLKNAFDYNEALKRQNLKQDHVDHLREKARGLKYVPKFIIDKQVCALE